MDERRLEAIKRRLEKIQELQWLRRFGMDEMNELLYSDLPDLIAEVEEDGSHSNSG